MEKFSTNTHENNKIPRSKFLKRMSLLAGGTMLSSALSLFNTSCKESTSENENSEGGIESIKGILRNKKYEKFIDNPYIVSTLYYSADYLHKIRNKNEKNPQENIINEISESITPEIRMGYMEMLQEKLQPYVNGLSRKQTSPIENFEIGSNIEENHHDAIDLFTKEGSPIFSMTSGIVVLAEDGWKENQNLSTSSQKGGNTIIIYNAFKNEFYRYAHLENVWTKVGDIIESGKIIGLVGHTGENASKPGHGNHLHLEINYYSNKEEQMQAFQADELERKLSSIKNNPETL